MKLLVLVPHCLTAVDSCAQNDYKGEDEMPNRCGLMHVRPSEEEEGGNAAKQQLTQEGLAKFCADLQARLAQFSTLPSKVRD